MKKFMFILIFVVAFLCICQTAIAAPGAAVTINTVVESNPADTKLAEQLKELGLFIGVGLNSDGTTKFDLDRAPTRTEALVMLIRVLGKESIAVAYPKTHPFADVQEWADGYISYAYDNGLTSGMSDTMFGACDPVSADMYMTFILRSLGYVDGDVDINGDENDFLWDSPWALASKCQIFPPQAINSNFTRSDVVNVTCSALYANMKGADLTLYERLISESVFTRAQFQNAFQADPFYDYRLIGESISAYIIEAKNAEISDNKNSYIIEANTILDVAVLTNGMLAASVYVGTGVLTVGAGNDIKSLSWQTELWRFELDAGTYRINSSINAIEITNSGQSLDAYFSNEIIGAQQSLYKGTLKVGEMNAQEFIDSDDAQLKPWTYLESLEYLSTDSEVLRVIESDACTILARKAGPHLAVEMYLIYKPGAAKGEGNTVSLPLPSTSGLGIATYEPDELYLSEDGATLHYSYRFDEAMVIDGYTYHEAGTYLYSTDLISGETTLSID